MDIEKLFKEFVEKEWHDGHEPQGGYDHYDEDEELDEKFEKEARSYIDRKKKEKEKKDYKKKYGREPFSFSNKHMSQKHSMGIAAEFDPELEEDKEDEAYGGTKKWKKGQKKMKKAGIELHKKDRYSGYVEDAEVEEGYKDLPPHLQKLVKKIEKKQKDWNKQNPDAKIKTLVYNPETGKPDIVVKENTMKLEDTVKQVLTGKPKLEEHCGVCDEQGIEEDSDKDEPGTQGDMKKYQAARAKVMKKFGVKSCSELEGDEKKACYAALDAAHVSDDEEEKGEKKEEVKKSYSKMFSHVKSLMQEK